MARKQDQFLVRVEARDIKAGVREDMRQCPIARAIKRRNGVVGCSVDPSVRQVRLWSDELDWIANLPPRMCEWADDFDDGRPVKPTSFLLVTRRL